MPRSPLVALVAITCWPRFLKSASINKVPAASAVRTIAPLISDAAFVIKAGSTLNLRPAGKEGSSGESIGSIFLKS